jgi:serine/threonine-protein kinase
LDEDWEESLVQSSLGKYELIAKVGQGAMGEVYKARDPFIGRLVALKTITGGLLGRPDLLERFYQEARSSGTLQHPNIVTIYELGEERDVPFIAMEFLEGESLDKLIEQRPTLPLVEKMGYIVPVCSALEYAHKRRIIHRDIKPGNVMLTKEGVVKVVDFGIARALDDSNTQTNMLIGTLGYMSPQQIRGQRADERSDIWALGVLFYELLCYERPFTGENHAALMMNIVDENIEVPSLREKVPDCPPELDVFIGKMLRKDAEQRFQTMEDVLFELEPLWRRLQDERVSELVVESEQLISAHELTGAQDLLRKALQINSSNKRAKTLLEKVNQEVRQSHVLQQAQKAVAKAAMLLEEGRFQDAGKEVEGVLKFGSLFAPDHEIFVDARRIAEQARIVEQRVQASKQFLAKGALTEAGNELEEAVKLQSGNKQLRSLQKQIQDQVAYKKERERLAAGLQKTRMMWAERRYGDCIKLLTQMGQEFPNEPEILKLLEAVRNDQIESARQQRLAEARGLLAIQQFEDALKIIAALQHEHPNDEEVSELRALAVQTREEFDRRQRFQAEMEKVQGLLHSAKRFEAIAAGEKLLLEFPQEPELAELLDFARNEEEKYQLESILKEVRAKIGLQEFQSAIASASQGLKRFPGNAELTRLLSEAERLAERNWMIQQEVIVIQGLVGKGALTEAQKEIEKALQLDAESAQLRDLQKQIQDQAGRRKERERLEGALQQARIYWAEQRYQECIQLLTDIRKEFPREQDVIKLLETARHDQAKQLKQIQLDKARELLAGEKFEDALKVIAELQKQYPSDRAAENVRGLILEAQEDYEKRRRIQNSVDKLRALINEANFTDAVSSGEKFLAEFPHELELTELVEFARSEQTRIDKKRRLDDQLQVTKGLIKEGRFSAAIQHAQQALVEFPQNTELLILLDRAKKDQTGKEKRELLGKRFKEIQQRIHREELTDAVDLARQTQVTVGPDPAIADLLHKAEWELLQKKRRQTESVQIAKTLIDAGNLAEATLMLQGAIETQVFAKSDSRVGELLEEIEKKRAEVTRVPSPPPAIPEPPPSGASTPSPSAGASNAWTSPTSEPARDYVYHEAPPLPEAPPAPVQDGAAVAFSTTSIGSAQPSSLPSISPAPESAFPKIDEEEIRTARQKEEEAARSKEFTRTSQIRTSPVPVIKPLEDAATAARESALEKPKRRLSFVGSLRIGSLSAKLQIGVAVCLVTAVLAVGLNYFRSARRSTDSGLNATIKVGSNDGARLSSQATSQEAPQNTAQGGVGAEKHSEPPSSPTPNPNANPKLYADNIPNVPANPGSGPSPGRVPLTKSATPAPIKPAVLTPVPVPAGRNDVKTGGKALVPALVPPQPARVEGPPAGVAPPEIKPNSAANATAVLSGKSPEPPPSSLATAPPSVQPITPAAPTTPTAKPAEPAPAVRAAESPDQQAIHNTIQQLSSAFSNRSMTELQGIWPKMGANKNALKTVFGSAQSFSREFHIASTTIQPDGASATVVGNYEGTIREGGKDFPSSGNFYVRLSKKNGKWLIDDASF